MMKKQYALVAMMALALVLTACKNSPAQQQVSEQEIPGTEYPEPAPEEQASAWLCDVLMSQEGCAITAERLAQLKGTGVINLPVNSDDVMPRMGKYENAETGATIVFKPYTNEKDTIKPICQADLRLAYHSWDTACHLPEGTCETRCIQNRGRGILAIYHIVHDYGPRNGSHRCYEDHPDGYPEYMGALLYVYPGADSLMYTCGYEASKRIYRYVK